ncbi:hypothetical protein [Cohnella abietis]|uniref:Uncharacterized protein n=1 Tax=Cohnella abietis TaxID=2507935 RepID=A0A3T1D2J8_9BACL|nr:hypothetical protein [Cohnella abietis]BBI32336.1 hypothetical protein KCTCHS21_17350 [Cohnella abietis]
MILTGVGKVVREDAETIVIDEGDGIATYSKRFYRLPIDRSVAVDCCEVPWIMDACNGDVSESDRWLLPHFTLEDAVTSYAAYQMAPVRS